MTFAEAERLALSVRIEEGFQQAERGELIDAERARREVQALKERWLRERSAG